MIVTFFLSLYTMYMVLYCGQFVFATIVDTLDFNKPDQILIIFRFSFLTFCQFCHKIKIIDFIEIWHFDVSKVYF